LPINSFFSPKFLYNNHYFAQLGFDFRPYFITKIILQIKIFTNIFPFKFPNFIFSILRIQLFLLFSIPRINLFPILNHNQVYSFIIKSNQDQINNFSTNHVSKKLTNYRTIHTKIFSGYKLII
jgi:hypothetical protein